MEILNLPNEYRRCFEILSKRFEDRLPNIRVRYEKSPDMTVGYKGGEGYIRCDRVSRFARLFGILIMRYDGGEFEVNEHAEFDTLGCMLDLSFGSALTVKSIFEFCEYISLSGYDQLQLYMEDMYEIKNRAYFGYMRGRYTYDELKKIDDYAACLGIEVVPSIQTLGHLKNYLCWPEAEGVKCGPTILPMNLLADSDETYEFIEEMILSALFPK